MVTVQGRMGPLGEAGGHHSVTGLDKHQKLNMTAFDWVGKRDLPIQPAFHIVSHRSSHSGLSDSSGSLNIGWEMEIHGVLFSMFERCAASPRALVAVLHCWNFGFAR